MYGTSATFGLTSGETLMPGELSINYPLGRSLDENYNIQLDSDSTKNGGVTPDLRVLLTRENMYAMYVDSQDVELDSAIEYLNSITSLHEENTKQPNETRLFQNYPNPFNPITTINYHIAELSYVSLNVYDVLGNKITTLVNEDKLAGSYEIEFDGSNLASGIYIYKLQAGSFVETMKMILLR